MNTPPETFEAHGHTWTKHTPGDPMPCDGNTPVEVFLRLALSSSEYLRATLPAKLWNWGRIDYEGDEIIGWRYADTDQPKAEPTEFERLREENRLMREAIKQAHEDLITISAHDGPGFPPGICATLAGYTLAKLQPFITPTK